MVKHYRVWRWWTIAVRGVAAIVFGILSLAWPAATFVSLVVLFGAYALVDGLLALSMGFRRDSDGVNNALIARGIVSILAGAVALVWPQISAMWLLVVIGAWAIVGGIGEIAVAVRMRKVLEHEWLLGFEGALSIAFGVALLVSPLAGAIVIGLWVGAYALVLGGLLVGGAFRIRSVLQAHPELAAA
jgi:uncharacterized membrane protein HdeD (DUF308 family)